MLFTYGEGARSSYLYSLFPLDIQKDVEDSASNRIYMSESPDMILLDSYPTCVVIAFQGTSVGVPLRDDNHRVILKGQAGEERSMQKYHGLIHDRAR